MFYEKADGDRLFGYDQGVMGGLLTLPSFLTVFPEVNTDPSLPDASYHSNINGITIASYTLGCFFGAVVTIFVGDILGRRKVIFLGSSIMVIGAALQCSAFSLGHLIAGRVITGVGNGMNTSTVRLDREQMSIYLQHPGAYMAV